MDKLQRRIMTILIDKIVWNLKYYMLGISTINYFLRYIFGQSYFLKYFAS